MAQTPEYQLIRSGRRTLGIEITPEGRLVARAPLRMPQAQIESFLREKAGWIARARERVQVRLKERRTAVPAPGGFLWLWGEAHPVLARETAAQPVWDGRCFYLGENGQKEAAAFLAAETEKGMQERLERLARAAELSFSSLSVGWGRRRLGSCSAAGNIRFSYRVACLPPAATDYLAAHELAHRRQMNHSPAFWRETARILPDFAAGKRALDDFMRRVDVTSRL